MGSIRFTAALYEPDAAEKIASGVMLRLPKEASDELPTKGMV